MRSAALLLLLSALAFASNEEANRLDPKVPEQRARLFELVRNGENGASTAAKKLAKEGYTEALLKLIETSNDSMTVGGVCQAVGTSCRPILLRRLEREPDNWLLVACLACAGTPADVRNPIYLRALGSRSERTREAAARALRSTNDAPLAEMRAILHAERNDAIRNALAVALLRHGDDSGVPWIDKQIREGAHGGYAVIDQLGTLVGNDEWIAKRISLFKPLLPALVEALGAPGNAFARYARRDARYLLVRLTRHDWGEDPTAWRTWMDRNRNKPLLHTRARDAAIKDCVVRFQTGLNALNKHYACRVQRGALLGVEHSVWHASTNNPRFMSVFLTASGEPSPTPPSQVIFVIGFPAQCKAPKKPVFEQRFEAQNLVAQLSFPSLAPAGQRGHLTAKQQRAIIELARASVVPLAKLRR